MPKVIAILPAYNEEKRIAPVIRGVKKFVKDVIVIDDGSTDQTAKISRSAGAIVYRLQKNSGKGVALKKGMNEARKRGADILLFMDADGQHDPKYVPEFITAIKNGSDYVYGKRDLSDYPVSRKIGNWGLTMLSNIFCPTGIKDTESGYRALTADAASKVEIKATRYAMEMDFVYSIWKNGLRVGCVPIRVPTFIQKPAFTRGLGNFFYLLKRRFNLI
jgi:glycosyltransferase involved in cell wall biosynthesis